MANTRTWTPGLERKIADMRRIGLDYAEIAEAVGKTPNAVKRQLDRLKVHMGYEMPPETEAILRELWPDPFVGFDEICRRTRRSRYWVQNAAKRLGLGRKRTDSNRPPAAPEPPYRDGHDERWLTDIFDDRTFDDDEAAA